MQTKIIGVTGGVGSGKSAVLSLLETRAGAHIIMADLVAHREMEPGRPSYEEIIEKFGTGILKQGGGIDRPALAEIVFCDEKKLALLNSIVHPNVRLDIQHEIDEWKNKTAIIAIEAALLIEAKYKDICDELWYIYADIEIRIRRLNESRGYSREKALSVMNNQLSDVEFRKHADVVINNSFSLEETWKQLEREIMR